MWFSRMLKVAGDKAGDCRSMHDIRYRVMGRCRWANRGSLASCALRTMRGGSSNTAQLIPDPERLQKKGPRQGWGLKRGEILKSVEAPDRTTTPSTEAVVEP